MREKFVSVLLAIFVGVMVPGIILRLASPSVDIDTPATSEFVADNEEDPPGLWVLDGEQLQWMSLEEYLTGVILAEMPTTYDQDALCAQAVAARTYALKRQTLNKHPQGAVCTEAACCQAYVSIPEFLDGRGYEADVAAASDAANSTAGIVLTYEGKLIDATYFHSSGGRTENALAVWGVEIPYLQVVESPGEEELEGYSDQTYYTIADLEQRLSRTLSGDPGSWLGWTTYTPGGGVERIVLAGMQYTGKQLRSLLKLDSTAFTVQTDANGLYFTTLGKGHRVGMSQTGAQAMALTGASWQEILAHYYPGTRIDKMEDVG